MIPMNRRTLCLSLTLAILCLTLAPSRTTAQTASIPEKIEWTWADRPEHPNPALPNVLLFGDSITRGYYTETSHLLAGHANCYLFATSAAASDPRLPKQVADYASIAPASFAVIHFNVGMHGWGYTEQQYSSALPSLIAALHQLAPKAALIWSSTTPVRKPQDAGATNPRIDARNQLALELMRLQHIPIDDQNALMLQHQDLHQDDVHFTPAGSAIQAQQAAQSILKLLPQQ
jgi:GDSL-like Lipase/Acylhydrolase family